MAQGRKRVRIKLKEIRKIDEGRELREEEGGEKDEEGSWERVVKQNAV